MRRSGYTSKEIGESSVFSWKCTGAGSEGGPEEGGGPGKRNGGEGRGVGDGWSNAKAFHIQTRGVITLEQEVLGEVRHICSGNKFLEIIFRQRTAARTQSPDALGVVHAVNGGVAAAVNCSLPGLVLLQQGDITVIASSQRAFKPSRVLAQVSSIFGCERVDLPGVFYVGVNGRPRSPIWNNREKATMFQRSDLPHLMPMRLNSSSRRALIRTRGTVLGRGMARKAGTHGF